ncbi:MAG TPA: hypothetical protein DCS67_11255 [Clostridiales bacterium UBA8960]|nr:hypothetical protein [Clostridiales bacterium UBA8960]
MTQIHDEIKKDRQIWKFSLYGFLKDLTFFEPYLLIYLMGLGLNLFQIGLLFAVREAITYIFEVPSGVFADHYGKKKELLICFSFYIVSFIFFFIGTHVAIISIGMVFFGLGEAFRSGTHKAMIYTYLEQKSWFAHKTYVYGRTRSFSLLGGSISSFMSILFILNLPSARWIFALSIIPYVLDFMLILSYPDSLDERRAHEWHWKDFLNENVVQVKMIFKHFELSKILVSSSLYDGIFKSIKDYIQPIMKVTILASVGVGLFKSSFMEKMQPDDTIVIVLGMTYGIFYLFSAWVSKNVHKLNRYFDSAKLMTYSFDLMGVFVLALSFAVKSNAIVLIVALFFILNMMKDARRPLFVDVCGDYMVKEQRATVMSVDSQLKALFVVILAPVLGFVADRMSIQVLFLGLAVFIFTINRVIKIEPK